jgi:toxin ParE1/3/4
MRLVVHATAWQDLDDIGHWIGKDSPTAARRALRSIVQTIDMLAHFPLLARPGRARNSYERRVAGTPYIIVFRLREKPPVIIVVAVVHAARDR